MKKLTIFLILVFSFVSGCDESSTPSKNKTDFYVKFQNLSTSWFTISSIELQAMGKVGVDDKPQGDWSDNILKNGKRIAPGQHEFFYLEIPNLHSSACRLGVIDSAGVEIFLHQQNNFTQDWVNSITHWGGDTRTVSVELIRNPLSNLISIKSWSDWVGIED